MSWSISVKADLGSVAHMRFSICELVKLIKLQTKISSENYEFYNFSNTTH